jgi:hypothetical protein
MGIGVDGVLLWLLLVRVGVGFVARVGFVVGAWF